VGVAVFWVLLGACGGVALYAWQARKSESDEASGDDLLRRIWLDRERQRSCLNNARQSAVSVELAVKNVLDTVDATERHLLVGSAVKAASRDAGEAACDAARASLADVREKVQVIKSHNQRVLDATSLLADGD